MRRETATVTRETGVGTTVRLTLEPAGDTQVRILEYWRKPYGATAFRRVREKEGDVETFDKLGLPKTYEELFPQGGLFSGDTSLAAD